MVIVDVNVLDMKKALPITGEFRKRSYICKIVAIESMVNSIGNSIGHAFNLEYEYRV